jgi:hypothetical protein
MGKVVLMRGPRSPLQPPKVATATMVALSRALGHPTTVEGDEGQTIDDALIMLAVERLTAKPPAQAAPEFDRDDDGDLLIDWSPSPGRTITLTLSASGVLNYAFHWDGDKAHGKAQMPAQAAPEAAEPVALDQERAAFEAWCVTQGWVERPKSYPSGNYVNGQLQGRWLGWMGRASFVTTHPAPVPLTDELQAEVERLRAIIDTPQSDDFLRAVSTEAEHQRQRWGSDHDAGKTPADWFWLVGYLAGKALHAHAAGNIDKAEHHVITTAAALANWHRALLGKTDMRPGIDPAAHGIKGGA